MRGISRSGVRNRRASQFARREAFYALYALRQYRLSGGYIGAVAHRIPLGEKLQLNGTSPSFEACLAHSRLEVKTGLKRGQDDEVFVTALFGAVRFDGLARVSLRASASSGPLRSEGANRTAEASSTRPARADRGNETSLPKPDNLSSG